MMKFDKAFEILMERHEELAWYEIFESELLEAGMAEILGYTVEELEALPEYVEWSWELAQEL